MLDEIKRELLEDQKKMDAWSQWEEHWLEEIEGVVFISKVMEPIPWHGNNTRRYHIYNNKDVDIVISVALVKDKDVYKVIEI